MVVLGVVRIVLQCKGGEESLSIGSSMSGSTMYGCGEGGSIGSSMSVSTVYCWLEE